MFESVKIKLYARQLQSMNSDIACKAAEHWGEIGGAIAVHALINALSPQWKGNPYHFHYDRIRNSVVLALGNTGSPDAIPLLREVLQDRELCESAAKAIRYMRDQGSFDALIGALYDARSESIIQALGSLGNPKAIQPLRECLTDGRGFYRRAAAEALAELGDSQWVEWIKGDDGDFVRLAESKSEHAFAITFEAFQRNRKSHGDTAQAAAVGLGKLRDRRAVEVLVSGMSELGKLGYNSHLLIVIAQTLGEIGDPRAIQPLSALLEGCKQEGRECPQTEMEFLDTQLIANCKVCDAATLALGKFEDSDAVDILSEQAQQQNIAALESLASLKLRTSSKETCETAMIVNYDSPTQVALDNAFGQLIRMLQDPKEIRRRRVALALGHLRDSRAVLPLTDFIREELRNERRLCHTLDIEYGIHALGEIGDPSVVETLIEIARTVYTYAEFCIDSINKILLSAPLNIPVQTLEELARVDDLDKAHWTSDPPLHDWVYPKREKMNLSQIRRLAREALEQRVTEHALPIHRT